MKRIPFITVVFLFIVSIFFLFIRTEQPTNDTAVVLQTAFSATGAQMVASEIYIRGRLAPEACDSASERRKLLADIIRRSGGKADARPVFREIDTDNCIGTQTDYIINHDSKITASILNEKQEEGPDGSVYGSWVTVSLTNTSRKQEMAKADAMLEAVLKQYCEDLSVTVCITGSMEGALEKEEVDAICDSILEYAGASMVEGLEEEELVSVSAFSPSIHRSVRVNGKRINLNVAVRYNSYEGRTYIWLASPVITTEY